MHALYDIAMDYPTQTTLAVLQTHVRTCMVLGTENPTPCALIWRQYVALVPLPTSAVETVQT